MPDAMYGDVDNGTTAAIASDFYTGHAGFRPSGAGVQVAYLGRAPHMLPARLSIDGVAHSAIERTTSAIPGFTVLTCTPCKLTA